MGSAARGIQALTERLHPAWVGVVGVLLYLPTLRFGLTEYDDPWLIRDNVRLQELSGESLRTIFFDLSLEERLRLGAEYLPLRDLSVMLDFQIWGTWFAGHHLTQVVLYGVLCALAAWLTLELFADRTLAWFAGAAFAIHPVHVEAVAWLAERKGVLGGALFFAAALFGVRYLRRGHPGKLVLCILFLSAAILSKAHMVAGAGALAMCALWTGSSAPRRWSLGAAALIAGALASVPFGIVSRRVGMVQEHHRDGLGQTLALLAEVHGKYLELMALGGPYSIVYPVGLGVEGTRTLVIASIGAVALAVFLGVALRAVFVSERRNRVTYGIGWWLIFLAPVSHVLFPIQNLMADRYLLVGSWGLLLVLGALVVRLPRRSSALVAFVWLLASLVWTVTQLPAWASPEALAEHTLRVHPAHVDSWNALAREAQGRGDYASALSLVDEGLQRTEGVTTVGRWKLFQRAALIENARGNGEAAVDWMRKAATEPDAHKAYANLGLLLARGGNLDEGLSMARKAVELQPLTAHNQRTLGIVALEAGETEEACEAFARALELEPYNPDNQANVELCTKRSK